MGRLPSVLDASLQVVLVRGLPLGERKENAGGRFPCRRQASRVVKLGSQGM